MGRMSSIPRFACLKDRNIWLALVVCTFVVGCRERPDQTVEEFNGAAFVMKQLSFYERHLPNTPITNLQQVFATLQTPYPSRYHYAFRAFGKHAGFKNSLFEKYVLVTKGFSNQIVKGTVAMLNAEAFPDRNGQYGRMICSKTDMFDSGWDVRWYSEEQVQKIFREAGQSIPEPVHMPPPPDLQPPPRQPLGVRVEEYFGDITRNWGLGTEAGKYLMWACFGFAAILAFVLVAIFWGRRLKRRR
jgi:hypothetical protein